jgi:Secretion system C-terminal sorting domain
MRRHLILISTCFLFQLASAQQNLDFEAPVIQNSTLGLNQVPGWTTLYAFGVTSNVGEGLQSIKIVSSYDPLLASVLNLGSDTVPGVAIQTITGSGIINPQQITIDFMYKYTPYTGDRGLVYVELADTMNTGDNDNIPIYAAYLLIPSTVSNWTNHTLSFLPTGNTGTINALNIIATASAGILDSLDDVHFGSTLWLDAFQINNVQFNSISEENTSKIVIYPNPTTDVIQVHSTNTYQILITNLNGETIIESTSDNPISMKDLAPGVYLCKLIDTQNNTFYLERIIKSN